MKVLFITAPQADYLEAQLYLGLCQVLGSENVIDYPEKPSYHGRAHMHGQEMIVPFPWMPAMGSHGWGESIVARMSELTFAVLASPREAAIGVCSELRERVMWPYVMVDGEDYDVIRWDLVERFRPRVYFKRELVKDPQVIYPAEKARCGELRIRPMPFAVTRRRGEDQDAERYARARESGEPFRHVIDVTLLGADNCPGGREVFARAVRGVSPNRHLVGWLPYDRMLEAYGCSKIVVIPRGHGQDTTRAWEALGVRGPLVAIQRHTLIHDHPFVDREHVVYFSTPQELVMICAEYLSNESARMHIAAAGHMHAMMRHTVEARARYLLKEALG